MPSTANFWRLVCDWRWARHFSIRSAASAMSLQACAESWPLITSTFGSPVRRTNAPQNLQPASRRATRRTNDRFLYWGEVGRSSAWVELGSSTTSTGRSANGATSPLVIASAKVWNRRKVVVGRCMNERLQSAQTGSARVRNGTSAKRRKAEAHDRRKLAPP